MQHITGLGEDAFAEAYWAPRLDYDRGHYTGRGYFRAVGRHANLALLDDQLTELIAADTILWTQVNQPMAQWAARLQAAGTPTGILSNLGDDMMHGVLATLPWIAHFHYRLWSHTLKMAKPQPEIYLHAAFGLGLPPPAILFVDDREYNIAGALAVGMQAIRYADQFSFEHEMRQCGLTTLWQTGALPRNGTQP
jgi:putative hydrolase of the HAD superfamily